MSNKILLTSLCGGLIVILASCGRGPVEVSQPSKVPTSSKAPEIGPTPVIPLAETLVSGSRYLADCRNINPSKSAGQIPYKEIWPGETRESDLKSLLGVPEEIYTTEGVTNWGYSDFGIFVENGIVTDVLADVEKRTAPTLEQLVLKYGCPDLILAVNTTQDQSGYTATRFIYLELGIEFDFAGFPVNMGDVPEFTGYFQPVDLLRYLERKGWTVMDSRSARPVDWVDAVR